MVSCLVQVDVPIKYLNLFLENDDELEYIKKVCFHAGNLIIHDKTGLSTMNSLLPGVQGRKDADR